jgi:uncharacterized protein YciI
MKFVAIVEYNADRNKADQFRPDHRAYCSQMLEAGKLAASGPLTDGFGGLFIYEVESVAEVEDIIKADPFQREGVFKAWTIRPWTMVYCNPELFAKPPM